MSWGTASPITRSDRVHRGASRPTGWVSFLFRLPLVSGFFSSLPFPQYQRTQALFLPWPQAQHRECYSQELKCSHGKQRVIQLRPGGGGIPGFNPVTYSMRLFSESVAVTTSVEEEMLIDQGS